MSVAQPPTAGRRYLSRARIVALQAAVGLLAVGAAMGPVAFAALGATGVAVLLLALVPVGGRTATGHLVRRLRQGALDPAAPSPSPARQQYGLAGALFPALGVVGCGDRNGRRTGVVGDGRGYAVVLELPAGAYPELPVGLVAELLDDDAARPATVQLLLEQHGLPPWDFHGRFEPTLAYRQLPVPARPVAIRSWLVLRYEPWEAPEVAEARGGGAEGARAALVAAAARVSARLGSLGVSAVPLDAEAATQLLRQLGDEDPNGQAEERSWAGGSATHCLLGVDLREPDDWWRLLAAVSDAAVDRVVLGVTFGRAARTDRQEGPPSGLEVRCAARLVSTYAQRAAQERDRLAAGDRARPLDGLQAAGLAATLPLAHPATSLVAATGFAVGAGER